MTTLRLAFDRERLLPDDTIPWRGMELTESGLYTLDEAARLAGQHVGREVTIRDVLAVAERGGIPLTAFVRRQIKFRATRPGDGLPGNTAGLPAGTVPKDAGVLLPLSACRSLAGAGQASWRALEEPITGPDDSAFPGMRCYFDRWVVEDDEPDIETVLSDCRVRGSNVKALADHWLRKLQAIDVHEESEAAPAPRPAAGMGTEQPAIRGGAKSVPSLATGEVAFVFRDIHFAQEKWATNLTDKPGWILACQIEAGVRGNQSRPARWSPVAIARSLVGSGPKGLTAAQRKRNAVALNERFRSEDLLAPFRSEWRTFLEEAGL